MRAAAITIAVLGLLLGHHTSWAQTSEIDGVLFVSVDSQVGEDVTASFTSWADGECGPPLSAGAVDSVGQRLRSKQPLCFRTRGSLVYGLNAGVTPGVVELRCDARERRPRWDEACRQVAHDAAHGARAFFTCEPYAATCERLPDWIAYDAAFQESTGVGIERDQIALAALRHFAAKRALPNRVFLMIFGEDPSRSFLDSIRVGGRRQFAPLDRGRNIAGNSSCESWLLGLPLIRAGNRATLELGIAPCESFARGISVVLEKRQDAWAVIDEQVTWQE